MSFRLQHINNLLNHDACINVLVIVLQILSIPGKSLSKTDKTSNLLHFRSQMIAKRCNNHYCCVTWFAECDQCEKHIQPAALISISHDLAAMKCNPHSSGCGRWELLNYGWCPLVDHQIGSAKTAGS